MKYSLTLLALAAAIEASPFPQGVTGSIAPSGTAPAGCQPTYPGTFGIAVMNITASAPTGGKAAVSQSADGQPVATSATVVSTIADGQPQAPTSGGGRVVSTIADGQPQAPKTTMAPVTQIGDGQIQAPTITMGGINQIGDGQIQNQRPKTSAVNQIGDGQIQNPKPTTSAVQQISDGQIQQPSTTSVVQQISDGQIQQPSTSAVQQISDGQIQKPTTSAVNQITDGQLQKPSTSAVGQIGDGQPQASTSAGASAQPSGGASYVSCKSSDTLQITLNNGILTDSQGRIGYIASNYQFQFDGPPQAGAIYTAGFSVCGNGSLALGGSNVFYQCLSGDFYNLYDRNWAPQCSPINIQAVELVNC